MRQDIEPADREAMKAMDARDDRADQSEPPGPDALIDAATPPTDPTISFREHIVRETLSDLENELTADHHLDESGLPSPSGPDGP